MTPVSSEAALEIIANKESGLNSLEQLLLTTKV
jgi:hypothetical protein